MLPAPDLARTKVKLNYGPRVKQFALRPLAEDARLNILSGGIRAGKTWALLAKIFYASDLECPIGGWRVLVGQTKDTIYVNVLKDLFDLIDTENYSWSPHTGFLRIFDKEWKILGAKDEGSEKFLRGSTIGVAICDELVLVPEGFFKMLLTRMSPAGARLYGTTNPDSPMHWLKTEYLDNKELIERGDIFHLSMTLDDNPNLPSDFVEAQKRLYKGLFYQRFIQGLWVMASGAIWGDAWSDDLLYCPATCDEKHEHEYIKPFVKSSYVDRWISCDYGTAHPHVYLEFFDDGDCVWLDREWFWDSAVRQRQLTDGQYCDELEKFMGPNNGCQVIIPPEALSFRQECFNKGIWVTTARNDVAEGIQAVAGLMTAKKLRINRACREALKGILTFCWDPNKAKRGIEQPLKRDDDAADCIRYAINSKIYPWRYRDA
jgi:PBSX family phage terminase large subunit